MTNFSLLSYNNIQANLGLYYLWQTIQELLQPLMPSLGPYKNNEMSPEILSCKKWFLEGCCELLDPENWLAHAMKAGEGPWNSLGNEAIHVTKVVIMYRKAIRRKGQFSRDRNCPRQLFFSRNSNLLGWPESQKLQGFSTFVCTHKKLRGIFNQIMLFSFYLSIRPFWVLLVSFKPKSVCDVFEFYHE